MVVPFLLAPMAELSHRALRELIESFGGCDEYFTEMISAGALVGGGRFESFYSDAGPCPERVVYQLVGSRAAQIAEAAALLDGLPCAGIDINMGCSAPAITRLGAGVRWMASIDQAGDLIHQVRPRTRRRLSVKLRIGFEDDFDYLVKFCRRLEAEGVDLITLHPRTAREKFRRTARWDYVGRLRASLNIPVAGNGDIANAEYMLNSLNYGWWLNRTVYPYNDPDHIVVYNSYNHKEPYLFNEGLTRYVSTAIGGTFMIDSDDIRLPESQARVKQILSNRAINALAADGVSFRPVEGNTNDRAGDAFVRKDGDVLYLAVFNFSKDKPKTMKLELERIGLDPEKTYRMLNMITNKEETVSGAITVELEAAEPKIFKMF
jgi:tRNA-dihydrouridine synthase